MLTKRPGEYFNTTCILLLAHVISLSEPCPLCFITLLRCFVAKLLPARVKEREQGKLKKKSSVAKRLTLFGLGKKSSCALFAVPQAATALPEPTLSTLLVCWYCSQRRQMPHTYPFEKFHFSGAWSPVVPVSLPV